ncbi:MAG: nickel pincer cofactor biosynthesis protein LarC [Candidatus Tectomicrobia bacterium]|nr:nickel pincer cofactor biosynthesis protein LarC [Candidatus Tectomicrobia bacterium]
MRLAYFDCFSGISGDMTLGALVDSGLDLELLKRELQKLPLQGYALKAEKVRRSGIAGTKVDVILEKEEHTHRHLKEIRELIEKSQLDSSIQERALSIFIRLAEAEAKVHHTTPEEVHFHEVGAVDAIVDVVGSVIGLSLLGIEEIISSPLNLGSGFVKAAHGVLPVPAPGTAELVKGFPVYSRDVNRELTTPTGAAIITTLASRFASLPLFKVKAIGYGAGSADPAGFANLLRVMIGENDSSFDDDTIMVMETNIDDMNPEFYDYIFEKAFEEGALDVFLTPILMKKGRPANTLTVLAPAESLSSLSSLLLKETSTFGVRVYEAKRKKLKRRIELVETKYGQIRVKFGEIDGNIVHIAPEYDDCKRIAKTSGVPIREVYTEAQEQAKK